MTKNEVEREDWIDASYFDEDCPNNDMDYVGDIEPEDRKYLVKALINEALPKGCFVHAGRNKIRYVGGLDKFIDSWNEKIKKQSKHINKDKLGYEHFLIKDTIDCPTTSMSKIYTDDEQYETIGRWISYEGKELKVGDILHVGGIVDFHI